MLRFKQLLEWLKHFDRDKDLGSWFKEQPLPPVVFSTIRNSGKPPAIEEVKKSSLHFVSTQDKPKWVLFQCPCGCRDVITLSLQKTHRPHWSLSKSENNRPILYPSVWRDTGCLSHFWIHDGRIYWCHDTGTSPFKRSFSV